MKTFIDNTMTLIDKFEMFHLPVTYMVINADTDTSLICHLIREDSVNPGSAISWNVDYIIEPGNTISGRILETYLESRLEAE